MKYDVLCSDIEDFKLINDTFGMAAGDRLLRQVAALCTQRLGDRGICGRLNADQFACLLEHREDYADEMFTQYDSKINSGFGDLNVIMKYGIYTVEDREVSVEQMCDRRCWRRIASRESMASTLPSTTISCGAPCCAGRPSRTV